MDFVNSFVTHNALPPLPSLHYTRSLHALPPRSLFTPPFPPPLQIDSSTKAWGAIVTGAWIAAYDLRGSRGSAGWGGGWRCGGGGAMGVVH